MNETADDLVDHAEQAMLFDEVSDAALEAAASIGGAIPTASIDILPPNCC